MSTVTPFSTVREFIQVLQRRKWKFYSPVYHEPVVSIISSFFNAHTYFEATYQSIINQTFQNFEWIIVDDCSTEPEAWALFDSLPQRYGKIKTLQHHTNRGLAAGRNTAIAHATGKYLFLMDLDDLIDPTYIEKCVLFLETHPEFSFVNSYSVGFQAQEYWWNHGFDKPARFLQQNWVTGRLLYRKSDFDSLGGFDEDLRFYEDWERWLKAITNHQKGWTIPEYLDCYRRLDSGLLETSRQNTVEEKRVTDIIQSRYQSFFQKSLKNTEIKRDSFDINQIRTQITVENPLKRDQDSKRILCFFPHLQVGGADKFNLDLVELLTNRNYDFTIVTTLESTHPWHQYFYTITPDIFHLPNILNDSHWLAFTKYIIESRQIEIIFISNCYIAYYFLPFLSREFPHIALIDFTHTFDPGWRGIGYPRLSCQFSQFLDYQVVASQSLANYYQNVDPHKEKIKICHINVDTEYWVHNSHKRALIRSNLKIADDTIVLLFPARIVEQKRPLFLVDIIQALISNVSISAPVSVIVIGDGFLLPTMQAKISQLGLNPYFHILTSVASAEMVGFYSAADILLLPSAYEGISLAIYEAMSMQLPVIAADVGGQAELVTTETGFLVTQGNRDEQEVNSYLQILLLLIQNQQLRHQIGLQARQRVVELFALAKMADQMEDIFTEAITLSHKSKPNVNLGMAEETLLIALEYLHQEQVLNKLWQENCLLKEERHELSWKKRAMESSKFWKLRRQWFQFKRFLGLTIEEEI
jgi:glycosyltransferase involved in cell wall biosynthesis